MPDPIRVRDLFDLPEQIRKGDFVHRLSEGVLAPAETARTYVVTPAIAGAFDRALKLVGSALRDGRSQASYIHGSFGSGKSHFMALLSLLLDGHEAAWRIPELHPLRASHAWVGEKKLLQLRFHMVGHPSLEVAIFEEYVRYVRAHHPAALIPPLFADEALFEDARRLLQGLGEAAFFGPMNDEASAAEGDGGFGDLETEGQWQRASFEAALSSTDPKERARLFDALARSHFKAFAQQSRTFVDLDAGLAVMADHAASLGFEGVVLFLDELVLWLAAGAANAAWLHGEVQKASKLVEAQEAHRAIPIVSFIARQRDLAEMVGEEYAGAENARLRDSLRWWEGRFDTVSLEDGNLPAIAERRVLTPKSAEARATLDEAFTKMQRAAGSAWPTLIGHQDQEAFRKLYPFSPALVETLVALSNSLQRQRTAIKLLMEILVDHIPDLQLGGLVPVGDLFDLLSVGDDTADGVMRARFEAAKQVYKYQLLPVIHANNGTGTAARCQRLRPDHRASLGCSGCPESACRNDNRLLKTLLLSALVPGALKDLTVSRLVQLNHGTLKTPIPGTESNLAAQRLQNYASKVGQVHIGTQKDPRVDIGIDGADLGPILEQAASADSPVAKQQVLRDLLFEAMGVDKTVEWGQDHAIEDWRKTRRLGHIRFGNVRRLGAEILRCPDNHDWRLVVDYPFDEPGHGPNEDLDAAERVREDGNGTWTLVWLPSFFSEATNKLLGELVVLEHILGTSASVKQYTQHLTVEHQRQAQLDLQNLRNQKRARLMGVIAQAYGLARPSEHDLDPSRSLESHLHVLKSGAQVRIGLAASLDGALESFIPALLEQRYPRHPMFTSKLTKPRIAHLYDLFGQLVDAEDKRLLLDHATIKELAGTLGVLGLLRTTETAAHLVEDLTLQEIERKRQQRTLDHPTAAEVRGFLDETRKMGLEPQTADLVVRAWARWAMRTFVRHGQPYEPQAGAVIPDDVILEKPPLPGQKEWSTALDVAGAAFGITLRGKALHADNLKRFETALNEALGKQAAACARLPGVLAARLGELGLPAPCDRATTAASAGALYGRLTGSRGLDQVRALAEFTPETSARALGKSIGTAAEALAALDNKLIFGAFQQVKSRGSALPEGPALLEEVAKALRQDELLIGLAARLRALAERAHEVLGATDHVDPGPGPGPSPGPGPGLGPAWVTVEKKAAQLAPGKARERLHALLGEIEAELTGKAGGELLEVVITVRARVKR